MIMGSNWLSLLNGPSASIFARDHSLWTTERASDRIMDGNGGSTARKNSPRVSPSADAIRSRVVVLLALLALPSGAARAHIMPAGQGSTRIVGNRAPHCC